MKKVGRNDPCPCGSGKKYKHCCGSQGDQTGRTAIANASIPQAMQAAVEHHQAGRLQHAETIYRKILQLSPDHSDALHLLGLIAHRAGKNEIAIELISKAIGVYPFSPVYHSNLGNVLKDQDKLGEAIDSYRKALLLKPDIAETNYNLGLALQEHGKLKEAMESYRKTLMLKPDYAEAHNNLGSALQDQGRLEEAVDSYRKALLLKPDYAEAHNNLGSALQDQGRLEEAVDSYRKALLLKPDYAEAHNNLGRVLQDQGGLEEAVDSYRKALLLKPDYAKAHRNLGNVLRDLGRFDAAVESYRKALLLKPSFAEAYNSLGLALHMQGKQEAAIRSFQKALLLKPDYSKAYSNLLFLQSYHALLVPQEYLSLARGWERSCLPEQDRQAARHINFKRKPLYGRRLRVGYVSGDYRQHAVSYFVEQLFAYHDRSRIELFAYSANSWRDAVTERLQGLAEHWVPLTGVTDAATRDRIEADEIDVLIDLSGHTGHNRLGVFARRAAPVQAHYLGFMASTGLTEMDYWIGDKILTPAETDSHFSEQVWRLPRVWVSYDGKSDASLPNWCPSQGGPVWLGSFNNLGKLTPATLALWAQVLHALPESKLLLKTKELADTGNRQHILNTMSEHGILQDRIELQDWSATPGWREHMAYYDRLDIALDPVGGVGGGTTTCDALWMGVPVITLEGDRMASRMTASMLNALGHPEWIARTEAEYIGKVVALARDVEQRKALRSGQRGRMAASPLCDARGLAAALENVYFEMHERYFAGKCQQAHTTA